MNHGTPALTLYDLGPEALVDALAPLPAFRSRQLADGLYKRLVMPAEMTDLPAELRARLASDPSFALGLSEVTSTTADAGATLKWLYRLADGAVVETVLMHSDRRSTVCISSQAGCAMACTFCATGDAGFTRQLATGEIVEQVVRAGMAARSAGRRLDHVVFMGMGEPLANYAPVLQAARRIIGPIGISQRSVTISTVGVVPGIKRLAQEGLQVNLAVSLHAANDALRDQLVPLNRRYPLSALLEACQDHVTATKRRLSFEWALMDAVNDGESDVAELGHLAKQLRPSAHVNLIPLNPTSGGLSRGLRGSPRNRVVEFRDALLDAGVNATIRRTRGREIDAACGQLAGAGAGPGAARPE